ncbi:hypothetical protein, partial [Bacillus cereus]|uniref:hypothetical protein n=1 Tax=Bacillus cereus TaxID=1396 RepID=UPI001CEF65F8
KRKEKKRKKGSPSKGEKEEKRKRKMMYIADTAEWYLANLCPCRYSFPPQGIVLVVRQLRSPRP